MNGRIIVGVDGSSGSQAALRFAVEEAHLRNASIHAVLAWHWPVMASDAAVPADLDPAGWAQATLDEALRVLDAGKIPVQQRIIEGHAAAVLIEAATGAELLVVGSRGHGGFTGLLLGSVSQHCVAHPPCPVVVVPSTQK